MVLVTDLKQVCVCDRDESKDGERESGGGVREGGTEGQRKGQRERDRGRGTEGEVRSFRQCGRDIRIILMLIYRMYTTHTQYVLVSD